MTIDQLHREAKALADERQGEVVGRVLKWLLGHTRSGRPGRHSLADYKRVFGAYVKAHCEVKDLEWECEDTEGYGYDEGITRAMDRRLTKLEKACDAYWNEASKIRAALQAQGFMAILLDSVVTEAWRPYGKYRKTAQKIPAGTVTFTTSTVSNYSLGELKEYVA